jgi:hypothetical protein
MFHCATPPDFTKMARTTQRQPNHGGTPGNQPRTPYRALLTAAVLVVACGTVKPSPTASRSCGYPPSCFGCGHFPPCGKMVPSDRFAQPGALSYLSGTEGRPASPSSADPPPGASDQGELTVVSHSQGVPVMTGVEWHFRTRNGSSCDAAAFTVRHNYLTPRA